MVLRPAALFGVTVPPGADPTLPLDEDEYPSTFRITMAAIDPSAEPILDAEAGITGDVPRATLKMIRIPDDEDDSEDEYDSDDMAALLGEDSEDDEDTNGGPSDPSKSPKAQRRAALRAALADAREEMDVDDDDDDEALPPKNKGKAKAAMDEDDDEEDSDEDSDDDLDIPLGAEEFVLCTLDPTKNFQQPLDITINEHERVLFQVTGTHNIYLTGNIMYDDEDDRFGPEDEELYGDEEEEDEYDLSPDEDELDMEDIDSEDEDDELDDVDDPRIQEIDSEEEEAPKLVKVKGSNKRAAEDSLDATPEKASLLNGDALTNGDAKLSKSQLKKMKKKMKDNAGNAIEVTHTKELNGVGASKETLEATKASPKTDKKVQFAKTLVQGPTPTKTDTAPKTSSIRTVQGVQIDDKKAGSGPQAKSGDRVSMRYIGKLEKDKKVFDANKKGSPFTFRLGKGEVIKGWDIGVAGMQVGGERRITIPAHLAYGSRGAPPDIPPNATLTFDLKVLDIKK